uniref:Uncharacterized protein n=1 Tax=Urocitellus parryii TaxID=9999 RepID=A0A8D2H7U9_UROPR
MQEIIASVDHIKFDLEIAVEQQLGAQPLPFPGMDKSGAAVCEFFLKALPIPTFHPGPLLLLLPRRLRMAAGTGRTVGLNCRDSVPCEFHTCASPPPRGGGATGLG